MKNLRDFIQALRQANEIIDIRKEVDPHLEIAEIHRRIAAENGPALFFHQVKNSPFPLISNLFGSSRRIELAFPNHPEILVEELVHLATRDFPPSLKTLWKKRHLLKSLLQVGLKKSRKAPVAACCQNPPDLNTLPLLTTWPKDGGPFITLPLVYTKPIGGGPPNLGMYRIQRYDHSTTGLHFQIAKGGGFHFHQAEKNNVPLPVSIFIGGPPALILSAITPLPENVSELLIASLLQGGKLHQSRSSPFLINECEFALVGKAPPHVRRDEGPFGDHYGYYSLNHPFPIFNCEALYHRKDAIFPATVVGKPRQEDFYIGEFLQKLLSPLFPIVMPGVKALWSYGETGFHSLSAAIVQERFYREGMTAAFRILGEGQLSLTKFLILTDQAVNLKNFKNVLQTALERFRPETDLFILSNLSMDTLDYTGPRLNEGSRGILLGIGEKIRDLPEEFLGPLPRPAVAARPFCPGCLVMQVPCFEEFNDFASLLAHSCFDSWPLLILTDNLDQCLSSEARFLWTVFTRFEPAGDLYSREFRMHRHHISYSGPILIDARMKPSYPEEVECDPETEALVSRNWDLYFSTRSK